MDLVLTFLGVNGLVVSLIALFYWAHKRTDIDLKWKAMKNAAGVWDEVGPPPGDRRAIGEVADREVVATIITETRSGTTGPNNVAYFNLDVPLDRRDDSDVCIRTTGIRRSLNSATTPDGGFEFKDLAYPEVDDISVGEDFDDAFEVAGNLSPTMKGVLRDDRLMSLLESCLAPNDELHIDHNSLHFRTYAESLRGGSWERKVELLIEIADRIDAILDDKGVELRPEWA